MAEYTEKMTIAVSPALKAAIAAVAKEQGRKPTALARYTLERVYLADQVTVEQCADLPPIPERTLEQVEDALYGPSLRPSKLVDTPAEYNAEAS